MKKINISYLFYFSGILWLFVGIKSENIRWSYVLGFVFIALGIAKIIIDSSTEDSEEGELLTDDEEKQVWKEFQGKVEEEENGTF